MKFGKQIQASQVPGWGQQYLNYKALKKIINSLAAGRPASEASLLALGGRPSKRRLSSSSQPSHSPVSLPASTPSYRHGDAQSPANLGAGTSGFDLEPLPPETEPPAPSGNDSLLGGGLRARADREHIFKAHRDVFFFTLQRELEKINTFYLIKERELRLRLLTLLSNRKRLLRNRQERGDDELSDAARRSAEWSSLEEGWRLFERDLGKLQGFIEINATGFRKILKKWDKRSKSNTKQLYIERQVEVQPCFNREFIAKLSDIVAANLIDLENASENLSAGFLVTTDLPDSAVGALAYERAGDEDASALALDAVLDLEANLPKALDSGRDALVEWLKIARTQQSRDTGRKRVMRVLWRAARSVADDLVDLVLSSIELDYDYIDNINDRSPLHEACIAGSLRLVILCVQTKPTLLERSDAYGRRPLHYAAMHGHPSILSHLLGKADPLATDMDGYTSLMHAITHGHLEVVRIFVNENTDLEPTAVSNDLIPLSLACQYGHVEVARLLLCSGAHVIANSEGLYPMHFAAKAGHADICQLLVEEGGPTGGGKDKQDKYNLWTPLHHAAVGGDERHLACIDVLVKAGCDVNTQDEYGKSPGWYAAWFGHVECLNYFIDAGAKLSERDTELRGMENLGLAADPQMDSLSPGSDLDLDAGDEFELIPSLSLPPPIIPLRVYGHDFLAKRCLVQIALGHPFFHAPRKVPPVKLYSRSGQDPLHLWSSLKLVMTSKSDITAVPHSVILPLADEREVFSFQVADLSRFTLELSLYPTFGSRVIGRAVILPSAFTEIQYHKGLVAPLLDHQLKAIGEVAFEVSCIKPFEGAQLEIGGRVETYWKSKVTPSNPTQDHAHQYQAHRPAAGTATGPSVPAATSAPESTLVTASSLSGEYVNVIVQVTRDGHPVAYSPYHLPVDGVHVGVADVSLAEFEALAAARNRTLQPPAESSHAAWFRAISASLAPLDGVLAALPADIGINLGVKYSRGHDATREAIRPSGEVNGVVDAVLQAVYDAGKTSPGRKIIFSSFDPTVCTALNWKQPNYAVFFASHCGVARQRGARGLLVAPADEEPDNRCLSVREAVNFAKSTNLLGVLLEAATLAAVPSLVASVKDAGLLLAAFGEAADVGALRAGASDGRTVDAFVSDGIMSLTI
ncbi:phosphate system positive regulatory protein pho81 [Cryptotrichosporon argae]